tara:strand:+ start:95 stop:490 length:396 start_codon:yes stop_codon:yes gene_type:complete
MLSLRKWVPVTIYSLPRNISLPFGNLSELRTTPIQLSSAVSVVVLESIEGKTNHYDGMPSSNTVPLPKHQVGAAEQQPERRVHITLIGYAPNGKIRLSAPFLMNRADLNLTHGALFLPLRQLTYVTDSIHQ